MDEHFSKKLRDMEIAPSERANELFRSRLEQAAPHKKNISGWYFAAAAAVVLAVGFLFRLQFSASDTVAVLPSEHEEPGVAVSVVKEGSAQETPVQEVEATLLAHVPTVVRSPEPEIVAVTDYSPVVEEVMPAEVVLPELARLSPEIRYRYRQVDLTDYGLLDVHHALELETGIEKPGLPPPAEKPFPLVGRMVREVRLVANGDKPDLDRAGIKPAATVLAYNQGGLLANESRQIKEGIHRFKEIFK